MKPGTVVVGYLDPGQWSAVFGLSYNDLMMHDLLGNQRIVREGGTYLRSLCGAGGIPAARNKIAADFLFNTDGEWLFFIDTDMGFAPDTVDRLVASADPVDRPIMGGLCFALKRKKRGEFGAEKFGIAPTVYDYVEIADEVGFRPVMDYPRDQVIRAGGTGAACLLIHRSVLESLHAQFGKAWFDPIVHPTGDKGEPRTFSEDLSFCVRAAAAGFPLHVDTSVKTCHEKGGIFLDESEYDERRGRGPVCD